MDDLFIILFLLLIALYIFVLIKTRYINSKLKSNFDRKSFTKFFLSLIAIVFILIMITIEPVQKTDIESESSTGETIADEPKEENKFFVNQEDFNNTKVEELISKYPNALLEKHDSPIASYFKIDESDFSVETSYQQDKNVMHALGISFKRLKCNEGAQAEIDSINEALSLVNYPSVTNDMTEFCKLGNVSKGSHWLEQYCI